jgi:hypothetical protein
MAWSCVTNLLLEFVLSGLTNPLELCCLLLVVSDLFFLCLITGQVGHFVPEHNSAPCPALVWRILECASSDEIVVVKVWRLFILPLLHRLPVFHIGEFLLQLEIFRSDCKVQEVGEHIIAVAPDVQEGGVAELQPAKVALNRRSGGVELEVVLLLLRSQLAAPGPHVALGGLCCGRSCLR